MKWNDIIFARTKTEGDCKFYAGVSLGVIKKERDLFGDPREMEIISMSDIPPSRSRALMCLYQEVVKDGLDLYNGARLLLPPESSACTNEDKCDEYRAARLKGCALRDICGNYVQGTKRGKKCVYLDCEKLLSGKCNKDSCKDYVPRSADCAYAHRCDSHKVNYLEACSNCKNVKKLLAPVKKV